MSFPKLNDMAVRITCVGHASSQWKSAKSVSEADRRNQHLSEVRAQNVRKAVEDIIKIELPTLSIEIPSKGVGSHERFPTASESNAAIDRSVFVSVELTATNPAYKSQPRAPRHVYAPSKIWTLQVVSMVRASGFGYVQFFLRVKVQNPHTGKEIALSGTVAGGGAVADPKSSQFDKSHPMAPIGNKVTFFTPEAMDFDDWYNLGRGHVVRVDKVEASAILKHSSSFFKFTELHTDPDLLYFDHTIIGLGWFSADAFVVAGKLYMEGPNPGDFLELASPPDVIQTKAVTHYNDGLILSFPTGKAALHDLTKDDRAKLTEFVVNKARNIGVFASSGFSVSASRP
jgi:hypothetical protein